MKSSYGYLSCYAVNHARLFERRNHSALLDLGQARAARQAEPLFEQQRGYLAATDRAVTKRGLQMHRLPDPPRFDVARVEMEPDVLPADPELGGVDAHTRQPAS